MRDCGPLDLGLNFSYFLVKFLFIMVESGTKFLLICPLHHPFSRNLGTLTWVYKWLKHNESFSVM